MQCMKFARDAYIPIDKIEYMVSYNSSAVKRKIRRLKAEGLAEVIDYTYGQKTNAVIFLTTGKILLTNNTVDKLVERMEKGNIF
uniref:extracellular matrix/biofilm biosynthesis regulator RemA family protein n=1 Tax=Lachnoclostridium phocaeense TaxID=1871021 RepID=UPI0026DB1A20|nr:extracellular matrix/biofilm biosynthesis regulator RemA family protein [Lachnoclostridium phocaeense]